MGLINSIGSWFEKQVEGWTFGTQLHKLIFKGNVEIQGGVGNYEHTFQNKDGILAHLDDIETTTRYVTTFLATEGQTVFTVTQPLPVGFFDVYLNGVKINEFTSTDFNITLDEGAILGDVIDIVSYNVLSLTSRDTRRNATDSVDTNTNYCGVAPSDALETDEVWTITKIVVAEDGSVVTTFAYDVAWTDRETTIYT